MVDCEPVLVPAFSPLRQNISFGKVVREMTLSHIQPSLPLWAIGHHRAASAKSQTSTKPILTPSLLLDSHTLRFWGLQGHFQLQ